MKDELHKHFCRLITEAELPDNDVIEFFDIVQSVASLKIVTAYTDDGKVSVNVTSYDGDNDTFIYEIVLNEPIDQDEGDAITAELSEVTDYTFDFETSMEL